MGTPCSMRSPVTSRAPVIPRVIIDQNYMCMHVFNSILETDHFGKILLLYIQSLLKHNIGPHDELSRLLIRDLVNRDKFDILHNFLNLSFLNESKPLACYLLSLGNVNSLINQMAIDMLSRLNATEVITEKNIYKLTLTSNL